jgi:CheY-like chemotaxis protein
MKNVFLAEDDTDDQQFFTDALKEIAISTHLTVSNDGLELMEHLETVIEPPPPHVIFLDLNMPRKNGFDCLSEIRGNPRLKEIPVVIFSTTDNQDMIERSYNGGANYYLIKPRSFLQLVKAIEKVLTLDLWQNQKTSKETFILPLS